MKLARPLLVASVAFVPFILALAPASGGPSSTPDGEKPRADLRPIANAYAETGDLKKALAALDKKKATPAQLLATLREPRPQDEPAQPGERSIELLDGHGTKTDLLVVAPTAEQIKAHAKQGLGLVVLLHGLGGKGSQALPFAKALADTGEFVAVAPTAQPLPPGEGNEDGVPAFVSALLGAKHWWLYESPRSFPLEAIKKARALYPIDPNRVAIAGASMGGFGTWNISLRHPDRFAAMAPLAGMLSRQAYGGGTTDEKSLSLLENGALLPGFVVHGTADTIVPFKPDKEGCDKWKEIGGKVDFRAIEGAGHEGLKDWFLDPKNEISQALQKHLTTNKRNPTPEAVTYVSLAERLDGAYWLRVAKREAQAKKVKLEAKLLAKENKIDLVAEGVELARVYVDERLLDVTKPVVVEASGKKTEKKVSPDFKAILESWRARQDEKLVYPAYIEVDPRR